MSARTGMFASIGAVFSAILSSACCWLPLSLMALGVSAGGIGAWFERYRWEFLGATGVLLGLAFWLTYRRRPCCEDAGTCAPRSPRWTRIMLWVSTVVVIAFAAFPKYAGALISPKPSPVAAQGLPTIEIRVSGMTCEACAVGLGEALEQIPGVADASVDYEHATARIVPTPGTKLDESRIDQTLHELGYARQPDAP